MASRLQTLESGDLIPRLLVLLVLLVLAALAEGDAASDGGVAPVRANRGGGLTGVITEIIFCLLIDALTESDAF